MEVFFGLMFHSNILWICSVYEWTVEFFSSLRVRRFCKLILGLTVCKWCGRDKASRARSTYKRESSISACRGDERCDVPVVETVNHEQTH